LKRDFAIFLQQMKDFLIHHTSSSGVCAAFDTPRIVAAGVFDVVHRGHVEIIRRAAARAADSGAVPVALSFIPHPRQLLTPDDAPQLLLPEQERVKRLYEAGAKECAFINFTAEVASWSPEKFLSHLADNGCFSVAGICVGKLWRFGSRGAGNSEVLADFCARHHWSYDGVTELALDGEIVSATAIRRAAGAGELDKVKLLSGRALTLYGTVTAGFQIAGTKLNAPTANLRCIAGVIPPDGVYAGGAAVDGKIYPAAVNIGFSPTFGGAERRVEVHLTGFDDNLYGRELAVELYKFIRPERKFASPDELKQQIAMDIAAIKAVCMAEQVKS